MLAISPHGRLTFPAVSEEHDAVLSAAARRRIEAAFSESTARGLLCLATVELETALPPELDFARGLARDYLTRRCQIPEQEERPTIEPLPPPSREELAFRVLRCPPMRGGEYLTAEVLATWWSELDALVCDEMGAQRGGAAEYLKGLNPVWRLVGKVTFHLAENKRDPEHPFAFLATYAQRLSAQARVQHQPLGQALQEFAGARNRPALVALLSPVRKAAEACAWVKELVDSEDVFSPLAWSPQEAYRFLTDVPALEASGLVVRVPDWWKAQRPPRPVVNVTVGQRGGMQLGADALLKFHVNVALDGEPLTPTELDAIRNSTSGLILLKGRWVEIDRDKLAEALEQWRKVERATREEGVSFFEGMRLLSGVNLAGDAAQAAATVSPEWTGINADAALTETLRELSDPHGADRSPPPGLKTELRPYQQVGVQWLRFMSRLGLGACLADDMGLGKTIQVIGLLLHLQADRKRKEKLLPSLLVAPASLVGNWKSELARFAPALSIKIAHPSESGPNRLATDDAAPDAVEMAALEGVDLVITTYGMLARLDALRGRAWNLAILDEAQAIKNSGARQTRAVKEIRARSRIALTGTPIENRASDLWSLFDFLNPGLLGGSKEFARLVKELTDDGGPGYGPLRSLVRPYLLRRLKTDKNVIRDLPEKTEVNAWCGLTRPQATLYERLVGELSRDLKRVEGIQRRGVVLAYLMRFKQVCNHPSQLSGDGDYDPSHSSKFQRLGELCTELAERQQKVLVFTQFRELTGPLADYLASIFGRTGLVLHGQTPVGRRRAMVEDFQRDDGPPFFVLSLKAGGVGLNLTEASHVIHFDRWWNPAVENQATDRAFRIGQKRNVLVQKFVCRGTLEERIDEMIAQKSALAEELLTGGGEALLTEMSDKELLKFISLDLRTAVES